MGFARTCWKNNLDLADAALRHPFVTGLADGTLPRQTFAGYVAQDSFYLQAFTRAYAHALAASLDRAGIDAFSDLVTGVRAELQRHDAYASEWGIDLTTVIPSDTTLAYTDFLIATASTGRLGLTCAAMTPCLRLYAYLGQSLAGTKTSDAYAHWVDSYADPDFEVLAAKLENLFDTYVEDPDRSAEAYRRAMRLEVAFFDSAYRGL